MKYANARGLKTRQWFTNEMLRQEDINRLGYESYQNMVDMLLNMSNQSTGAEVIKGLDFTFVTGMSVRMAAGSALSHTGCYMDGDTWGFAANPDYSFGVIVPEDQVLAFDNGIGETFDRVDIVEIRPVVTNVDSVTRNFKDPITGLISTAIVATGKQYTYEVAIRKGSGGVTPSTTAGWIKLAEVRVDIAATSISQNDVTYFNESWLWSNEIGITITNKSVTPALSSTMKRDAAGRSQVNNPVANLDIANKLYVDILIPLNIISITGALALSDTTKDLLFKCSISNTNYQIVLPQASFNTGRKLTFFRTDTNLTYWGLDIVPYGSERIGYSSGGVTNLIRLAYTSQYVSLVSDGAVWVLVAGSSSGYKNIVGAGALTLNAPITGLYQLELVGAGGGTGGCGSSFIFGASGAGGGASLILQTLLEIGVSYVCAIGAGGVAGAAGNNAGGNGGPTSLNLRGSVLTAGGGLGTSGMGASGSNAAGAGGVVSASIGGAITINGQAGEKGMYFATTPAVCASGAGGDSHYGSGRRNIASSGMSVSGDGLYGGGAPGLLFTAASSIQSGVAGADGAIIMTLIHGL